MPSWPVWRASLLGCPSRSESPPPMSTAPPPMCFVARCCRRPPPTTTGPSRPSSTRGPTALGVGVGGCPVCRPCPAFHFTTVVPGGATVPCCIRIGVRQTHTRQGVLYAMHRLLHDAVAQGKVLASLRASEAVIYGRFGFAVAGETWSIEIDRRKRGAGHGAHRCRFHSSARARRGARHHRRDPRSGRARSPWCDQAPDLDAPALPGGRAVGREGCLLDRAHRSRRHR